MNVSVVQVVAVVFALFALSRVILRLKDGNLSRREFLFWVLVWVLLVVIAFVPDFTTSIANILGIQRGFSLIVTLSLVLLFYLIFRLYIKLENAEQGISRLVQQIAYLKETGLKDYPKETDSKADQKENALKEKKRK